MCCKTPEYFEWPKAMTQEIKKLEKMRCWKVVKLSRASVPHGAKLIPCCWVSQLKFRDGVYECHHARLLLLGYQQEKRMRLS